MEDDTPFIYDWPKRRRQRFKPLDSDALNIWAHGRTWCPRAFYPPPLNPFWCRLRPCPAGWPDGENAVCPLMPSSETGESTMAFVLGAKSRAELNGVHPDVVRFVELTLKYSTQDFSVHDGLRTEAEQREYVRTGASQTMNSLHRKQADGWGHAVDLVPFINGKLRWEWGPIYVIAAAAKRAAADLNVRIRWGGCWQELSQIKGAAPDDMERAVAAYGAERRRAGKKAFTDGPHFELVL